MKSDQTPNMIQKTIIAIIYCEAIYHVLDKNPNANVEETLRLKQVMIDIICKEVIGAGLSLDNLPLSDQIKSKVIININNCYPSVTNNENPHSIPKVENETSGTPHFTFVLDGRSMLFILALATLIAAFALVDIDYAKIGNLLADYMLLLKNIFSSG